MFTALKNAWAVPELRKKMLFTLFIILLFRIGSAAIAVPFINTAIVSSMANSNEFASYINLFTGGGFAKATLFALSISPYITSSIVVQLLAVAFPNSLGRMQKEGEEGRKKLGQITRYGTVVLAVLEAFSYYMYMRNGTNPSAVEYTTGFAGWYAAIVIIFAYTAGSAMMMWLAEAINQKGIGNGISILLFAGIVANLRNLVKIFETAGANGGSNYTIVVLVAALLIGMVYFVVFFSAAERRVPVQYAKRVVGRKVYGGQNTHIPIKINMSGVMPIIFANALLSIPTMLLGFGVGYKHGTKVLTTFGNFLHFFSEKSVVYLILYIILIVAFGYFYVRIIYDPIEIANNLRKNNGMIPGLRPGAPTSDYINKIVNRVTLLGGIFLSIVVFIPFISGILLKSSLTIGGTTVLILVSVAIDTSRNLESQIMVRHYKGFLE